MKRWTRGGVGRWPTACLKRRRARPNQLTFAPLSKAPYVHTLHRRPHQHARRMIEPARACVRARARVLCAVRCALHVHVPFAWYSLLVAAGARLPADPCCSQRWRLTPRFASSAQAQCAGVAGAAIVAGAVAWPTSPPGLWRALVLWQLFYRFSAPSASLYWNVSPGEIMGVL